MKSRAEVSEVRNWYHLKISQKLITQDVIPVDISYVARCGIVDMPEGPSVAKLLKVVESALIIAMTRTFCKSAMSTIIHKIGTQELEDALEVKSELSRQGFGSPKVRLESIVVDSIRIS